MEFSTFGRRFTRHTGARELMDDLGAAMASDTPVMMLGGGNPRTSGDARGVPRSFRSVIADEREFRRMVADYPDPAESRLSGPRWRHSPGGIRLAGGSAQHRADGRQPERLLPAVQPAGGATPGRQRPQDPAAAHSGIHRLHGSGHRRRSVRGTASAYRASARPFFKYHVDAEAPLPDGPSRRRASRPTNPSGNVLTDGKSRICARWRGACGFL